MRTTDLSRASLCLSCALVAIACAGEDRPEPDAGVDARTVGLLDASCGSGADLGDCRAAGISWGMSCSGCFRCWVTDLCGDRALWFCRDGYVVGEAQQPCDDAGIDGSIDAGVGCTGSIPPPMGDCDTVAPGAIVGSPCDACFSCTRGPDACGGTAFFWCESGSVHAEGPEPCDAGVTTDGGGV